MILLKHFSPSEFILIIILIEFRFPSEEEQKKQWLNAINMSNDVDHQCKGSGWICNLHFVSVDIERVRGRFKLKIGAVPTLFDAQENQSSLDADQNCSNIDEISTLRNSCNECNDLILERNQLKRMLLKNQIDANIQLQIKEKKIEKLEEKCYDQILIINSLKEKDVSLEKMVKHNESQIRNLQEQLNLNVNFVLILLIVQNRY